ncbi:unnamed protein product, partial [Prorocentrum cordatum]
SRFWGPEGGSPVGPAARGAIPASGGGGGDGAEAATPQAQGCGDRGPGGRRAPGSGGRRVVWRGALAAARGGARGALDERRAAGPWQRTLDCAAAPGQRWRRRRAAVAPAREEAP